MCTDAVRCIACIVAVTVIVFVGERSFASPDDGKGGYESDQGTRVFGTMDPELEGVSIPFNPSGDPQADYESLRIVDGHLMVKRKGKSSETKDLKDLRIVGETASGNPVTLVIKESRPHKNIYDRMRPQKGINDDPVWEYNVIVRSPIRRTAFGFTPQLCDTEKNVALIVPASWDAGQLSTSTKDTRFTFACVPVLVEKSDPPLKSPIAPVSSPAGVLQVTKQSSLPAGALHAPATGSTQQGGYFNSRALATMPSVFVEHLEHRLWHGGVAAKCIDFHYAPWAADASRPGRVTITNIPMPPWNDTLARKFHNVCVQAMTANYAGDGFSHTVTGTRIALFDLTDMRAKKVMVPSLGSKDVSRQWTLKEIPEPQYDNLMFEGVWREYNGKANAACLAKVRWQTIDPNDNAFKSLRDLSGKRKFCEELTLDDLVKIAGSDKTLLVSYSAINDRGLYWLANNTGGITTTRVHPAADHMETEPGIPCTKPCDPVYLGHILSPDAPRAGFGPTVPLYLYKNDKGEYMTSDSPPQNNLQSQSEYQLVNDNKKPEGYLFSDDPILPDGTKVISPMLWLWKNVGDGIINYLTSRESNKRPYIFPFLSRMGESSKTYKMDRGLGHLLLQGLDIPRLVSTPIAIARPFVLSGPDPVENPEMNETTQQLPMGAPAPATTRPVIPVEMPGAQASKVMQQTTAASAAKGTEQPPAAHAPAATPQTPQ